MSMRYATEFSVRKYC